MDEGGVERCRLSAVFGNVAMIRSIPCKRCAGGFTLIEMMIVVSVLGVLAAMVVPRYRNIRDTAEANAAATSMVAIAKAATHYHATHGEWPKDKNRRVLPTELLSYLPENEFEHGPIGGVWDYEDWRGYNQTAGGDKIGIAISIVEGNPEMYEAIDRIIDDGNLDTGVVRECETSPRLVYILKFD